MSRTSLLGTGWAFPIAVDVRGAIKTSSEEKNIEESIRLILRTSPGERVMRPDFGCAINEMVFAPNTAKTAVRAAEHVKAALLQWEPRIIVHSVTGKPDEKQSAVIQLHIEYEIRSVNTFFNMVYPFYLDRSERDSQQQFR